MQLARQIRRSRREEDIIKLAMHGICEAIPYLRTVCGGRVGYDEILSMSYVALTDAARNFRPGGIRFFCYAKVYLRSELAKWWKSQDIVKHASEAEDKEYVMQAEDYNIAKTDDVDSVNFELIDIKERWAIVKPLLSRLTERERMVMELVYISGLSFTDISKILVPQITREAVRCCHERALRRLRLALLSLQHTFTI